MIQTISDAIQTRLDTLTVPSKPLSIVYNHHTLSSEFFPFATFELESIDAIVGDSCNNERTMKREIFLIQEMNKNIKRSGAITKIYELIEETLDVLDNEPFPGIVKARATGGNIAQYTNEKGNVLIGSIELYLTYLHAR